jgi:ParB family chromosome partitioning protein
MNKRTDAIRRLFAADPAPALSADNAPAPRRVAAGAVRSMKDTFSDIERENEALRAQAAAGERIVEIDPDRFDPSPYADRFAQEDDDAFVALRRSIEERGQEIPILARPHPKSAGRYQIAFGHRRMRAAAQLNRPLKAIVRALSDEDLIVAQGVENAAREDLSFIERAIFALRLEMAGVARAVVQQALAIDRAEASKLIAVARAVPESLARAIGKSPKAGRGRWQVFADAVKEPRALARAKAAAAEDRFATLPSDERFLRALAAATRREADAPPSPTRTISDGSGKVVAHLRASDRDLRLKLREGDGAAFAEFLAGRLPALFDAFRAGPASSGRSQD